MREVKVRYSEALVREAVRAFYWRTLRQRFGWTGALAFVVTLAALAFLVLADDRSWIVGFAGACLVFVVVILAFGYIAHYRNTMRRFRRMTNPEARFVFTERDFSVTSELGSATLPWSSVREVWAFPRLWLLLLSRSSFVTLPLEGVDQEVLSLVRAKVPVS